MRYRAFIRPWPLSFNWQTGIIDTEADWRTRDCNTDLHWTTFFAKRRYRKLQRQVKWLNKIEESK